MTVFDWLFIGGLTIALPIYELFAESPEKLKRESVTPQQRIRRLWKLIIFEIVLLAVVLALWISHGRSWPALGWRFPMDFWFWIGCALCVAAIALLMINQSAVLRTEKGRATTRAQLERMAPFTPRSNRELRHWIALSIAAGVCEEIVYRGYIFWCGWMLFGDSTAATTGIVLGSAIIFMLAHTYQGRAGMIQTFVVALVMGVLYVMTRSLWPLIVLHAVMDINGGLLSLRVMTGDPPAGKGDALPTT